jgi:hypothetical protein
VFKLVYAALLLSVRGEQFVDQPPSGRRGRRAGSIRAVAEHPVPCPVDAGLQEEC